MPTFAEFSDPRLAALYDALNPFAADTRFYLRLAAELRAARVVDVGCGTGLLTCELAGRGRRMIGVDPSSAMLDVARHRAGSEGVRWMKGDARRLGEVVDEAGVDLALMTGHVAQEIREDEEWSATLTAIREAPAPGRSRGVREPQSPHPTLDRVEPTSIPPRGRKRGGRAGRDVDSGHRGRR